MSLLQSVKDDSYILFKCGVEMHYKSFIFLSAMTRHDADREFML